MELKLRDYQRQCLEHAKARNTIVCLPTGFGKTLIAAKLIEHYLQKSHCQRVAFLVPTRPLVDQQATYCKKHIHLKNNGDAPRILKLIGTDQSHWTKLDWESCKAHIFLGTAALFQDLWVKHKYLSVEVVSLIVFDECHNAVGNSPMASVMRDAVSAATLRPRILGLTASFVNGSLRNMEQKRRSLEALLLSTIYCPEVQPKMTSDRFTFVQWERELLESTKNIVQKNLEGCLQRMGRIKEVKKVVTRCLHVYQELGKEPMFFYLEKVIVNQIIEKAKLLQEKDDDQGGARHFAAQMLGSIPALQVEVGLLVKNLRTDKRIQLTPSRSKKLDKLVEVLTEIMSTSSYRGIVFVEQVALVSALAEELNKANVFKCGVVAGTGYQSESDRQTQLEKFAKGTFQVLVATATLEEGIDVADCGFVIRYTFIQTTKAHIQGAGRARHRDAMIYYFDNDPILERQKEQTMLATAKNSVLSLSVDELKKASQVVSVDERHPYPFHEAFKSMDGEVNVFNCKQIFNQYCSICLGTSIQPKKQLYTFMPSSAGAPKIISRIKYPSPTGWQKLEISECHKFWSGVNLDRVFPRDRSKKKSSSEKEEMCFVYLVVVKLRETGLLDPCNRPSSLIRLDTKRNCPLASLGGSEISVKNTVVRSGP